MKYKKAYLTVEASYLIPMLIFLIVLTLYFSFYCFDRSVSIQNGYIAALRASNQWESSEKQKKEFAYKEWESLTENLFIMLENKEFVVNVTWSTIETKSQGYVENLFADVSEIGIYKLDILTTSSAKSIYPAEVIRKQHRLGEMIP